MRAKLLILVALLCATVLAAPVTLAAQVASPAASPVAKSVAHGSLLAVMDQSADPRRDFYRYATGGWQSTTAFPNGRSVYGVAEQVEDVTEGQLLQLLKRLADSRQLPVGSDEWKAVQLYAQFTDLPARNAAGIAPVAADLAAIDAIATPAAFQAFLRDAPLTTNVWGLFSIYGAPDYADSSVYAAWYTGPALGLPNRDYYWIDDEETVAIREVYRATAAELLGFAGYDAQRATDAAGRVYALEKRLAEPLLGPEAWNDPQSYYHPRPVADLIAANPEFDWPGLLAQLGIADQETIVVTEPDYLEAVSDIVAATDLETLKDYLTLQVLWFTAPALSEEIADTAFAFTGGALWGAAQPPLDVRGVDAVNASLGFALGKLYVDAYFSPEAKAQVAAMVAHLVDATRHRLQHLSWMTPKTRQGALAKLDTLRVKVGYPDTWRTYGNVTIEESLPQTLLSADLADYRRQLDLIGQPVDRDAWPVAPQEVNAYYDAPNNEIIVPAAILQAPYFDVQADPAYNYGGIGAAIGHEITHAYDRSGAQFDAEGNLVDWWTAADTERFATLITAVADQYSAVEVLPGLSVDGDLTVSENIADMGGLQIAHDALRAELRGNGDPGLIEGLSQDQRFFIAYAYSWAEKARDAFLKTLVRTDTHAPARVRAAQPARNMDAFADAFSLHPGDPMYLPPQGRIVIW
jgi:predicted metalloendopeptidase